jgi:small subunit ribosomal protein S1
MAARYDAEGNFIYPEGFDADSQEWRPGFEAQREEWERQYAEAQARFLAHKKQKEEARAANEAAEVPAAE